MNDDIEAIRIHWLAQNKVLTRIRELHSPVDAGDPDGYLWCGVCRQMYPCLTIKALDGEK